MGIKVNLSLLNNASGDGTAQTVSEGGSYLYMIAGTFGGATYQLQILGPDGTTFMLVTGGQHTAAGNVKVDIPAGSQVRAFRTVAGTPSAMFATLGLVQSAS